MTQKYRQSQRGLSLLITLLFTSVLLGISASLLNVSLKQYKISGIALSSEMAFQAAQAGLECALYQDFATTPSPFAVPSNGTSEQAAGASIACMTEGAAVANSNGTAKSTDEQLFEFTWGTSPNFLCTRVSVYKFTSDTTAINIADTLPDINRTCPIGGECTVIKSRGYNVACNNINGNNRVVERELTQIY